MLSCLWDSAYKRFLAANQKIAREWRQRFSSLLLSCPLLHVQRHIIINTTHVYNIHTHIYIYIYIYKYTYMHVCIHSYIHTYVRIYMHTYIHTCMHTYIHIHIYIHTCLMTHFYENLIQCWTYEKRRRNNPSG